MRYLALAIDFDGTLAQDGHVRPETVAALHELKATRRLVLVTGRRIPELESAFPELSLFDRVVAENGAVTFNPATGVVRTLAAPPPDMLLERLGAANVPFETGQAIVALWAPHETDAFTAIAELGLEYWVSFNKGAVMLLPAGHTKATGLESALHELGLSPLNAVAMGDAENDHSMLIICGLGIAVANAVPALRLSADVTLTAGHGEGVEEVAYGLIRDDLRGLDANSNRRLRLGISDGEPVYVSNSEAVVLVIGASGAGKSSYALGILNALVSAGYQAVVVDPEGDYCDEKPGVAIVGSAVWPPTVESLQPFIHEPRGSVVACLIGAGQAHRRAFLTGLLHYAGEQREATGRPHWLMIDEAHQLLYDAQDLRTSLERWPLGNALIVTVYPEALAPAVLQQVTHVVALSDASPEVDRLAVMLGVPSPVSESETTHRALLWAVGEPTTTSLDISGICLPHTRHARKYAEGDLGPGGSFYFHQAGTDRVTRARNILDFATRLQTIDEATWRFHQDRGDFARWLRECIRDETLAEIAEAAAAVPDFRSGQSKLREGILARYCSRPDAELSR